MVHMPRWRGAHTLMFAVSFDMLSTRFGHDHVWNPICRAVMMGSCGGAGSAAASGCCSGCGTSEDMVAGSSCGAGFSTVDCSGGASEQASGASDDMAASAMPWAVCGGGGADEEEATASAAACCASASSCLRFSSMAFVFSRDRI